MFSFFQNNAPSLLTQDDQRNALRQGLLGFASGALSGGYSTTPQSGFGGLGQGLQGFMQARQGALDSSLRNKLLDRQITREDKSDAIKERQISREEKLTDAQIEKINKANEAQARLEALFANPPSAGVAPGQPPAGSPPATPDAAPQPGGASPGSNPALIRALIGAGHIGEAMKLINPQEQTGDIKEFQFAKSQGFTGSFEDWMRKKRAVTGEYGMQPIYGTDAKGNPAVMQLGKDGKPVQVQLPPGFSIAKEPIKADLGTHFAIIDPQTRQIVQTIPKNVAGEAAAKESGKEQGAAQVALPGAISSADNALNVIKQIREHPGKSWGVGTLGGLPAIPGTAQAGFVDLVNQAKGQAFLQAYNNLKGTGAISEAEGAKATQAIARLERARRPEDFDNALSDLESVINTGKANAMKRAGQGSADQPSPTKRLKFNPATGNLE